MHRQRDLCKFGTHTQQRRTPHPEHSPRTADGNGARYARNVAGAHRARQRCAYRLKRRHRAIRGILFAEHPPDGRFNGVRKFADLQKACPHAEKQPYADDAHHGGDAPHKIIDSLIDRRNRLNH